MIRVEDQAASLRRMAQVLHSPQSFAFVGGRAAGTTTLVAELGTALAQQQNARVALFDAHPVRALVRRISEEMQKDEALMSAMRRVGAAAGIAWGAGAGFTADATAGVGGTCGADAGPAPGPNSIQPPTPAATTTPKAATPPSQSDADRAVALGADTRAGGGTAPGCGLAAPLSMSRNASWIRLISPAIKIQSRMIRALRL